jgi:hypothetical protein
MMTTSVVENPSMPVQVSPELLVQMEQHQELLNEATLRLVVPLIEGNQEWQLRLAAIGQRSSPEHQLQPTRLPYLHPDTWNALTFTWEPQYYQEGNSRWDHDWGRWNDNVTNCINMPYSQFMFFI